MKALYIKNIFYKRVKGQFFKNVLLALIFFATIPPAIVFLVTCKNYNKILSNQINDQYIYMIQQYNEDVESKINSIVNSTNNILLNEDVKTFNSDADYLYYNSYNSFVNINNLLTYELQQQYNWITSIYLFYPKNNLFIADGYYKADNFYDTNILDILNNVHINNFDNFFITRKIHYSKSYNGPKYFDDTLTVIRPVPFTKSKSFLVINIKGTIFKLIKGVDENFNGLFMVINNKNDILYTAGNTSVISNIIKKDIIKKVSGTYEQGLYSEKNNFTVLYSSPNKFGFRTIMIAPQSIILFSLYIIKRIVLIVCIFILLLSFFLSYYMSNRLYKPVYDLLNIFRTNHNKNVMAIKNEFQYIQDEYRHVLEINDEFSKRLNANLPILRELFLMDLLKGKTCNDDELKDKMNFLDIKIKGSLYTVFIVLIDDYNLIKNKYDNMFLQHLKYTINEYLTKNLDDTNTEILYASTTDDIIVIKGYDKISESQINQLLRNTAIVLYNTIKNLTDISISISVGIPVEGLLNISRSYTTANDAINYIGLTEGKGNIIYASDIVFPENNSIYYPSEKERNLLLCIFNCNIEKANSIFNEIIDEMISKGVSYEIFQQVIIQITNTIMKSLAENNICLFKQENLYKQILEMKTAKNIKAFMENIFVDIINYLEKNKLTEKEALVSDILEYIHQNYNNNINLEITAEHFKMSRQYFSKFFNKNIYHRGFNEYLNNIRLEKSLEYLEQSDYSIKEIAEKVGFSSSQYYIKLFKEKYNVTPGQYREFLQINRVSDYQTGSVKNFV